MRVADRYELARDLRRRYAAACRAERQASAVGLTSPAATSSTVQ
jgi:hypothetical protein